MTKENRLILLQDIDKQYGSKILYKGVNFTFQPTNRYGLIGHNGAGKSVLLRIISGKELPDSGTVTISSNFKVAYLAQEADIDLDKTPMEIVLEPYQELLEGESLFEEISNIEDHNSKEYIELSKKLSKYQEEITQIDIYSLKSRAATILSGLGVLQEWWENPISTLSGGFRMRVVLATLLLQNPDFLIMDEPTNHLDMDSLIWLERFLLRFSGGILLVSHDRDFMNRVITHTLEIAGGKIRDHKGNIDAYFKWKAEHEEHEAKRVKNLTEKIEKNERFVERFKSKATKASQARSRMKYLDKLKDELPEEEISQKELSFTIPPATPCGSTPIRLEKVVAGYGNNIVLNNVSTTVTKGDKVAIIGPNGAGKSTLMKVFSQQLEPFSGKAIIGHNADIRFFSQHRVDDLDESKTLYETIAHQLGENRPTEIRKLLGSFLFSGDEVLKKVEVLSGGEKSRLSLLVMLVNPGNTLLLDEPTNHLDMDSIASVANALAEYDGTVIVVSHDESFISKIANRIIEVRPGQVRDFPGNLKDYRSYCEEGLLGTNSEEKKNESKEKSEKTLSKEERIANREKKKKVTRQLQKIEKEIEEKENYILELEAQLMDEENVNNHELLISIQSDINKENELLAELMEKWEYLQTELEEVE